MEGAGDRVITGSAKNQVPDAESVIRRIRNEWDAVNQCCYALPYEKGPIADFIKTLKHVTLRPLNGGLVKNDAHAKLAAQIFIQCLRVHATSVFGELNCRFVLPVPGHTRGYASWNLQRVAADIAKAFDLHLLDKSLLREHEVPASHLAGPGERPTHEMHLQSLSWTFQMPIKAGILMLDDVIKTGTTSQACKHVIMQKTGLRSENIARLFLAKAGADD